jgi:hypothetical protein
LYRLNNIIIFFVLYSGIEDDDKAGVGVGKKWKQTSYRTLPKTRRRLTDNYNRWLSQLVDLLAATIRSTILCIMLQAED